MDGFGYEVDAVEVVKKLAQGPLAAAIQYNGCEPLMYYQSGVLRSSDCTFTGPDHAVIITGYIPAGPAWENAYESWHPIGQRWHNGSDPVGGCGWDDETYDPDNDKCIQWEKNQYTETIDGEAVFII